MAKGQSNNCGNLASAAASVNATLLSSVPCDVYQIIATNTTASLKYLKLYNKNSAPTASDTPFLVIALAPNNAITCIPISEGVYFNQGLGYRITGAAAASDTTALIAGDVVGLNILFI